MENPRFKISGSIDFLIKMLGLSLFRRMHGILDPYHASDRLMQTYNTIDLANTHNCAIDFVKNIQTPALLGHRTANRYELTAKS